MSPGVVRATRSGPIERALVRAALAMYDPRRMLLLMKYFRFWTTRANRSCTKRYACVGDKARLLRLETCRIRKWCARLA